VAGFDPEARLEVLNVAVPVAVLGVTVVPLNLTVLDACAAPKPVPATVTGAPTAPPVGLRLVVVGPD
jgi:hypothetical protein